MGEPHDHSKLDGWTCVPCGKILPHPNLPVNVCLLGHAHGPHDWWYTSEGGGHMLYAFDDRGKNMKQHWCPGMTEAHIKQVKSRIEKVKVLPADINETFSKNANKVDRSAESAAWNKGLVSGIAFAMRLQNNVDTWEPKDPYSK